MNNYDLIASLVSSLAWPAAVVVAVLVLRAQLQSLFQSLIDRMPDLREVNGPGGLNAKWDVANEKAAAMAAEVSADLPDAPPTTGPGDADELSAEQRLDQVAALAPSGAVMLAFKEVEDAVTHALERFGIERRPTQSMGQMASYLRKSEIIDAKTFELLMSLRTLRNQAAHMPASAISEAEAREYLSSARQAVRVINSTTAGSRP